MRCPKCLENIDEIIKQVEADIWDRAAKAVSKCMKHYEGNMGDPNGCLLGLAIEFDAMRDGEGPDDL